MSIHKYRERFTVCYKKWHDEMMDVVMKLISADFSQPFFIGIPSSYANSKKTVIV